MTRRIYAGVAILAACGIIAAAWLVARGEHAPAVAVSLPLPAATSTPEPPAGTVWSSYTDEAGDFTLQYPSDFLAPQPGDKTEPDVIAFLYADPAKPAGMQIDWEPTSYPTAVAYFSRYPDIARFATALIDGLPALEERDAVHWTSTFSVVHGGRLYTIMVHLSPADTARVEQSFHFLH